MTTIHTQLQQYTQDNYNNTHKTTTTTHTRQPQQHTQDNYNNTHKTTTTTHTRQLQQHTQDNYNNTHKTTTTIHTRQLQQYTRFYYFFNLGARWGGWSKPRPGCFNPRKYPVPFVQETGWATGPLWTVVENLAHHRDSIPESSSP